MERDLEEEKSRIVLFFCRRSSGIQSRQVGEWRRQQSSVGAAHWQQSWSHNYQKWPRGTRGDVNGGRGDPINGSLRVNNHHQRVSAVEKKATSLSLQMEDEESLEFLTPDTSQMRRTDPHVTDARLPAPKSQTDS